MEWATNYRFKFLNLSLNRDLKIALITGMVGGLLIKNNEKGFLMRGHLGQYVIVFPKSDLIIVRLKIIKRSQK